ncbi:MAG: hypothetical protein RJQ00_09425 [Vicingaceae bacterium]
MQIKKILFPLFSIFLIYQCYSILSIDFSNQTISNFWQFVLAFLFNLFLTGVFAFTVFVFPTSKLLPENFYKIHNPRLLKKCYTILKVNFFRKLLLLFFWGSPKYRKKYFKGTKTDIDNLIYQSKQSEFGHFMPFILSFFLSFYFLNQGLTFTFLMSMLVNIIANFYPVILQRHHRMRINRIKKQQ